MLAARPNDVVQAVLDGIPARGGYGPMPGFAAALDDAQVAALANYVRGAWTAGVAGAPATPALVAGLRAGADVAAAGTEAARRLCPAISPVGAGNAMAPLLPGAAALMRGADTGDLANRTDVLLRTLRRDNPGIGDALLADTLIAAYCPTLANDPDLSADGKADRLARFRAGLERALAGAAPPPGAPVVVSTALPPEALARAEAAARAAGKTLDAWLAEAVAAQAAGRGGAVTAPAATAPAATAPR